MNQHVVFEITPQFALEWTHLALKLRLLATLITHVLSEATFVTVSPAARAAKWVMFRATSATGLLKYGQERTTS